jgi:hypothetical protein
MTLPSEVEDLIASLRAEIFALRTEVAELRRRLGLDSSNSSNSKPPSSDNSCRDRDGEGFRKLAYRALATGEFAKHRPARGVAEGAKDGVGVCCGKNRLTRWKTDPRQARAN